MLDSEVDFPSGPPAPATAAEAASAPPVSRACANCGALVATEFCGHCGQRNAQHLVSLRELIADVVDDQLSVNGTLARTILPLLLKPGYLTQEYLRGRIVSYVAPLRLLLIALAVYLLAVEWQLDRQRPAIEKAVNAAIQKKQADLARAGKPMERIELLSMPVDTSWLPDALRPPLRPLGRKVAALNALPPGEEVARIIGPLVREQSRGAVLMVPIVAAILQLIYIRRRRLYAEHFVFTMHLHAMVFLGMAVLALVPWSAVRSVLGLFVIPFTFLAMKRVYEDGWLGTTWRFLALGCAYLALFMLARPFVNAALILSL